MIADGKSKADIAKHFGVCRTTVRVRLDPSYADHRRKTVNEARRIRTPSRAKLKAAVGEVFATKSGLTAIRVRVVNRVVLGSGGVTDAALYRDVSLPFVSIQHTASEHQKYA